MGIDQGILILLTLAAECRERNCSREIIGSCSLRPLCTYQVIGLFNQTLQEYTKISFITIFQKTIDMTAFAYLL